MVPFAAGDDAELESGRGQAFFQLGPLAAELLARLAGDPLEQDVVGEHVASSAPWLGGASITNRPNRAAARRSAAAALGDCFNGVLPGQVAQVVADHDVAHAVADEIDLLDAVEVVDDVAERAGVLGHVVLRARISRR